MKPCYAVQPGVPGYPDYLPLVARDSFGCAEEPPKPWPHGLPQGSIKCCATMAMNVHSWVLLM